MRMSLASRSVIPMSSALPITAHSVFLCYARVSSLIVGLAGECLLRRDQIVFKPRNRTRSDFHRRFEPALFHHLLKLRGPVRNIVVHALPAAHHSTESAFGHEFSSAATRPYYIHTG